jgi:hypothetical protein
VRAREWKEKEGSRRERRERRIRWENVREIGE